MRAFTDSVIFAIPTAKRFKGQIGCQKVQGRIAKSPAGRAQTMPSEDAKCSVSEVQQPPQPARRMEPVSRLSRLLSLSHSRSLGLSPLRAEQSIRAELEVTTGHHLNQCKPHSISFPPTRALPPFRLSLFPFLSPRILRSSRLPGSFSFTVLLSPRLSLRPSCLFQAWIIHRPCDVKGLTQALNEDRWCISGETGSSVELKWFSTFDGA